VHSSPIDVLSWDSGRNLANKVPAVSRRISDKLFDLTILVPGNKGNVCDSCTSMCMQYINLYSNQ
jgi:hypothetical protein